MFVFFVWRHQTKCQTLHWKVVEGHWRSCAHNGFKGQVSSRMWPSGGQREADAYEQHHFCIADMWRIRKKLKAYRSMHMFSSPKADLWHQFHKRLCDVGMLTASKKDQELFCKAQIIPNKLIPHQVIVKQQKNNPDRDEFFGCLLEMGSNTPTPPSNPAMRQACSVAPGSAYWPVSVRCRGSPPTHLKGH